MTKKRFLITIAVVFIVAAAVFISTSKLGLFGVSYAMKSSDFTLKNFTDDPARSCYWPKESLEKRCQALGGEIKSETTAVGLSAQTHVNCFPKEQASDAGKSCKGNEECEGFCVWLAGDLVAPGSTKTCSSYKKPFFAYGDDYINGPALERPICYEYLHGSQYGNNPFVMSEFEVKDIANKLGPSCLWPKMEAETRCREAGGRLGVDPLEEKLGLVSTNNFGCYPYETASDAGKTCSFHSDCEGKCVASDETRMRTVCSSNKKPLFAFGAIGKTYAICPGYSFKP